MSDTQLPKLPDPEGYADPAYGAFAAFTADQMRAYLPAPQQATPEPVGEPWGWAVNSTLFRGEFAEADAKAEAKRCGGTTRAVALYTNPAPAASAEREARVIEQNARKAAQEQLYAERERHTAEVKRLQAEIGRLKAPAASVSDAVAIVRERYRGTKWGKAAECICDAVDEAILALRPAQAGDQWREAVEEQFSVNHTDMPEDPREAIKKLIATEVRDALDPTISSAAAALAQAGVPEGWKLVPVEPTPEMKAAGIKVEVYSEASDSIGALTWDEVKAIYRAMLAAAPNKEGGAA